MTGKWLALAAVAVIVAGLSGCSKTNKQGRLNNDPTNYARTTKNHLKEFLQEARENPKGLAQSAAVLLESLEVYPTAPVGDYESQHKLLTEKCKALIESANRSTSSAETNKLLQDMIALANQLPD